MAGPVTIDDLLAPSRAPPQAQSGQPFTNVDELLTHGAGVQNPQNQATLPGAFDVGTAAKTAFFNDPQTQLRIAARALYPNDPKAVERFRFVGDRIGEMMPDGRVRFVSSRPAEFLGSLVANTPEMVGGAIGSLSASPVGGAALGVAGARGWKQAIAGSLFGEPQTIAGNVADMAVNAGLEAATAGLAKGAIAGANRGRTIDVTPGNLAAAQAKRTAIQQGTGVNVDLALASGDRRLIALRNWLAQQPNETAAAIQSADTQAAGQFGAAVNSVLDKIAAQQPADVLGSKGVNAAQAAIRSAEAARDAAVAPYYEAARKISISGDVSESLLKDPVLRKSAAAVERSALYQRDLGVNPSARTVTPAHQTFNTEEKWIPGRGFETTPKVGNAPRVSVPANPRTNTVGFWHAVQRNLDDQISTAQRAGNRNQVRILTQARQNLSSRLEAASPEFAQANQFYAQETSKTVEPLKNSVVGIVADIKDPKLATAAAKLFRDTNVTPQAIASARAAISKQDPKAWNGLVRQFIANEFERAQTVTQAGNEVNAAGKLYQSIWGSPQRRARMDAALGTDASQALRGLMETAETLAEAPIRGSNTQPNQAIQRVLQGPAGWWTRVLLNPKSSMVQAATERAVDQNAARLWEALSDPAKVAQLKIAVKISDRAQRVTYISSVILGQTGKSGAETATQRQQ